MLKPIKVVDLFAGPGGLGEGFSSVGADSSPTFKIVASIEKEESAHKTLTLRAFVREFPNRQPPLEYYQYLRKEIDKKTLIETYPDEWCAAQKETFGSPLSLGEDNALIHNGISQALGDDKEPWVLIGGPPCQAYSLAGRARNKSNVNYSAESDHRNFLYQEYLTIIAKYEPTVFVMENVKGILSSTPLGTPIFGKILDDLRQPKLGGLEYNIYSLSTLADRADANGPIYNPKDFIIKSEEFGVPQCRHRVILLGIRSDISVNPNLLLLTKTDQVSVKSILKNMPKLRSGLSKELDTASNWHKITNSALSNAHQYINGPGTQSKLGERPLSRGAPFIRAARTLSNDIPKPLHDWLIDDQMEGVVQHESRSHMSADIERYSYVSLYGQIHDRSPRIKELPIDLLPNHKNVDSGNFVDRFKVQLANYPSKTITSHIAKDSHAFIHYDPLQARGLTVREAARLQTFPENYFFEGNRTQQYVQVGNAVPPYLASQIGVIIAEVIALNK
jgi:DNA (cytosine-5)-methyltransferase 1